MSKANNNERYFNFPIQLIHGFLIDENNKCLSNISNYAVYEHSLRLEYGDEIEAFKSSCHYFGINFTNIKSSFKNGQNLYQSLDEKSPKVGINLSIFWDYHKNDKNEFQKVCLLGFLAIKSILQNKPYCKIDNKFWLSRIDGKAKSVNDFIELSSEVQKYNNEYQTKKIKTELRDNWNLITYSRHTRGFYVSFKLTLEQLILEAEKRRKSTIDKHYKKQEKEALCRVLEKLNNHTTITRPIKKDF